MAVHRVLRHDYGREEALSELQRRIDAADIRNDAHFRAIVGEAKVLLEISEQELADALLVSRTTINRWIRGKNLPHPLVRGPVFGWISQQLERKLKRLGIHNRTYAHA